MNYYLGYIFPVEQAKTLDLSCCPNCLEREVRYNGDKTRIYFACGFIFTIMSNGFIGVSGECYRVVELTLWEYNV